MGISSLFMGESHTNPWNSLLFIGEFHNFLCFFSAFPPVFVAMPCRSHLAAAAGVAAVSLALLLRRKRGSAKAFPPAKAVEDRGLWMAMDGYGYGEDLGGKRNTKPIPNIFP